MPWITKAEQTSPVADGALTHNLGEGGTNSGQIWGGAAGGAGDTFAAAVWTLNWKQIQSVQICCALDPGGAGIVECGIYLGSTGARVGLTAAVSPAVGLQKLLLPGPLVLLPGQLYYFALGCNVTGATFLRQSGGFVGTGQTLGWNGTNVLPSGIVNCIAPTDYTASKNAQRYWQAGTI